jgi:hypothetical protein
MKEAIVKITVKSERTFFPPTVEVREVINNSETCLVLEREDSSCKIIGNIFNVIHRNYGVIKAIEFTSGAVTPIYGEDVINNIIDCFR